MATFYLFYPSSSSNIFLLDLMVLTSESYFPYLLTTILQLTNLIWLAFRPLVISIIFPSCYFSIWSIFPSRIFYLDEDRWEIHYEHFWDYLSKDYLLVLIPEYFDPQNDCSNDDPEEVIGLECWDLELCLLLNKFNVGFSLKCSAYPCLLTLLESCLCIGRYNKFCY